MSIVSSCSTIRIIEKIFETLEKDKVSELVHDTYKDGIPNYTHVYHTRTNVNTYVKSTFKYDKRNGDKAYFDISQRGIVEIFRHLSFYTILKAAGINMFDKSGNFNRDCLNQISLKIFELTGQKVEIRLLDNNNEKN